MRLERIQRDFLWGGGNQYQKPHLVKWSTVCIEKKMRGFNVRSLSTSIRLFCNMELVFANDRDALERGVIRRKFGELSVGWCSGASREVWTSIWKEIRKEWETLLPNAMFLVGEGRRVRFKKDRWCGEEALCPSFPSLFNLAAQKMLWLHMFG